MNYVNPLSQIRGLIAERVDQGVDFQGSGPILAIGNAKILETNGAGWPGGPYMSYQLLDGPDAGRTVYVAENIRPTVHVGQTVKAGQPIAQMLNLGTGIEMGWADQGGGSPLSQTPQAGGITGANLPQGGTLVGRNFESLLHSLGVPAANNLSGPTGGKIPAGFPTLPPGSGNTQPAGSGGLFSWPTDILNFFGEAQKAVHSALWIVTPSNWVRIVAFLVGFALLLFAVHAFIAAGNGQPIVKLPETIPVPIPI